MAEKRLVHRRGGFTLIEVVIGLGLSVGMLLVVGFSTDRALGMFRQRRAEEEVGTRSRRALLRIMREVTFARATSLDPEPIAPMGSDTLTFETSTGVQGGAVVWSPPRTVAFEYEDGEFDDGVDNNGNGTVDEGVVVWIEDEGQPTERRITLVSDVREYAPGEEADGADNNENGLVDERGLAFELDGEILKVRIALEMQGPSGYPITKAGEISVFIRN